MAELDHMIPEFTAESGQLLRTVESGLLQMESGEMGEEAAHQVFRAIHAIRSGAAMVGLGKIQRLARRMEALLDLCRNGDLEPAQVVVDSLLQALDVLASLCARVDEHESIDIESSLSAMEAARAKEIRPSAKPGARKVEAASLPAGLPFFEISEYGLERKLGQGKLYCIHLSLALLEERGLTPLQMLNELISMGEVLDCVFNPPSGEAAGGKDSAASFDFFYATPLEQDLIKAALRLDQENLRLLDPRDFKIGQAAISDGGPEDVPQEHDPERGQSAAPPLEAEPGIPAVMAPPRPLASSDRTAFSQWDEPPESDESMGREYLTFSLGLENYGVDILSVQEIITLPRLTKLPRAPKHVLGVMNLRGMVVPVMDMRLRLDLPVSDKIEPVVVVVQIGKKLMGAAVDSVSDVVEFKESDIQDPPDFAAAVHREYLRGLCRQGDDLVVILDLAQILATEARTSGP